MHYRTLGKTGYRVSTVSFGAWAIGGSWGPSDDATSMTALHRAVDRGVNFFDTADVYGDGRSERLLGRLRKQRTRVAADRDQGRTSTHAARGRGLHRVEPRGIRRSQPASARRPTRSISSNCTARPPTCTTDPRCSSRWTVSWRRARSVTTASAWSAWRKRSRRWTTPAWHRCRSSTTCSANDLPTSSSPRRRAATSASSPGCRCRRGC